MVLVGTFLSMLQGLHLVIKILFLKNVPLCVARWTALDVHLNEGTVL